MSESTRSCKNRHPELLPEQCRLCRVYYAAKYGKHSLPPLKKLERHKQTTAIETKPAVTTPEGPGTELKNLLHSVGLDPIGCKCNERVKKMNEWGVEGCNDHRAEIIAWLKEEQEKRGWMEKAKAAVLAATTGLALKLNPLDPIPDLVDEAIRRYIEKTTKTES